MRATLFTVLIREPLFNFFFAFSSTGSEAPSRRLSRAWPRWRALPLFLHSMLSSLLGGDASASSPPPPPTAPPRFEPNYLFEQAVLPFVKRVRRLKGADNFSLLELGSWSGLYALELGARYPRSTLVGVEPNRTVWARHAALAKTHRRSNVVIAHNLVGDDVAEALSHANEFLDGQLLLSLHTMKPFDHGVTVSTDRLGRLDLYIGHLLSLARRTLMLLPASPASAECRDNRLANWALSGQGSAASADDSFTAARIRAAGRALNLRVHAARRLRGLSADGCEYDVWEATLLRMDRVNRHHFCLGGCKTHTRRTYRMIYTAEVPPESADGPQMGAAAFEDDLTLTRAAPDAKSVALVRGVMNMSNTQTGRHIPFETGSLNMHSLLSLQSAEEAGASVTAATATRQALILMFLSLPVFQDPAPWNVVWRAGELFPIDVGDGTTLEERGGDWNTFAQKYIGSLNECYRMSLKWLCMFANSDNGMHGDEKYEACMSSHFGASFCPPNNPFPCVTGCNRSYQACPHLPPRKVTPGYFIRNNVHTRNGKVAARFSQWRNDDELKAAYAAAASAQNGSSSSDGGIGGVPGGLVPNSERFGAIDLLIGAQAQKAADRKRDAARRAAKAKEPPASSSSSSSSKSEGKTSSSSSKKKRPPPPPPDEDDDKAPPPLPPPTPAEKKRKLTTDGSSSSSKGGKPASEREPRIGDVREGAATEAEAERSESAAASPWAQEPRGRRGGAARSRGGKWRRRGRGGRGEQQRKQCGHRQQQQRLPWFLRWWALATAQRADAAPARDGLLCRHAAPRPLGERPEAAAARSRTQR